jgi:hypothetical protein
MYKDSAGNSEIDKLIQWLFQIKKAETPLFSSVIIEKHRIINFVPFHQQLQALKNEQQQISLQHTNALFEINKLFNDKQIPLIHLKGPSLSFRIYQDFTKRCYVDLDLLIQEKDINEAISILKNLNYQIKGPYFHTPKQKEIFLRYFHHITFHHPDTNCFVELHWKLAASRFISKTFQKEVWSSTKTLHFGTNKLTVLNEIDEFIYLCIHGSRHHFNRLNWLVDVINYIKLHDYQFLDEILVKAKQYKLSTYVFHALYLLNEFDPEFLIPQQKKDLKSIKLCRFSIKQLKNIQTKNLITNFILFYKSIYILHGLKGVFIEMKTRSFKPDNWNFFYFPDQVFFLNQFFSRPIWFIRKFAKK